MKVRITLEKEDEGVGEIIQLLSSIEMELERINKMVPVTALEQVTQELEKRASTLQGAWVSVKLKEAIMEVGE